jgi:hypothetical protein
MKLSLIQYQQKLLMTHLGQEMYKWPSAEASSHFVSNMATKSVVVLLRMREVPQHGCPHLRFSWFS